MCVCVGGGGAVNEERNGDKTGRQTGGERDAGIQRQRRRQSDRQN